MKNLGFFSIAIIVHGLVFEFFLGGSIKGYLLNGNVYMYTADGKKFSTTVYKLGKVLKEVNHQKKPD